MIHSNLELRIEQDQLIEEEKNLDIIMERFFEEIKRDDQQQEKVTIEIDRP